MTSTPCSSSRSANDSERLAGGNLGPDVHRRRAAGDSNALACEEVEEERPLAAVPCAGLGHVLLVAPGDHRRALDELLWSGADGRPERLQRRDQRRIAGRETAPVARHRAPLGERVEDDDVRPVGELQRRGRRLVEPELGVRLVGGDHEAVLTRERGQALVEAERRGGGGGVVRIVDPEDGEPGPGLVVDRIEVGQEALLLPQRQGQRPGVREQGAALVDRVAGVGVGDRVARPVRVDDGEREREDRLLAAERRDDLRVGVEPRPKTALRPGRDRLAQLRQPDRGRVAHPVAQPVDEGLADLRVGRLARIAGAEVDHVDPARLDPAGSLVEAHERVGRLPLEDGGDGHG